MKFAQTIIAATALTCSQAINLEVESGAEANTQYTFAPSDEVLELVATDDPDNKLGLKGALETCQQGLGSDSDCMLIGMSLDKYKYYKNALSYTWAYQTG